MHNDPDNGITPGLAATERACMDHPGLAPLGTSRASPGGLSPPGKDEARTVRTAGFERHGKADKADSRALLSDGQASGVPDPLRESLRLALKTMQSAFALPIQGAPDAGAASDLALVAVLSVAAVLDTDDTKELVEAALSLLAEDRGEVVP